MKTLKVTYNTVSQTYTHRDPAWFLCHDDNVKIGDTVVIPGKSYYYAATVVEITDGAMENVRHQIIDVVDDSVYKQRIVNDAKRRSILKQLDEMDKKRRDADRYAYLGALDPVAAKMLEELKTLS